ncbi:sigma-54-dependent transcriptional regulator [Aliikangiella sp. IMCC44653]
MSQILLIDDNNGIADALEILFSLYDIRCVHADTPERGMQMLNTHVIDLVIQDMNFSEDTTSGNEGKTLFKTIQKHYPDLPVILLTAWGNLEMAVELVKQGAADYITKPWDDNKLITTVKNLTELGQLRQQTNNLLAEKQSQSSSLANQFDLCGTIFSSDSMRQTLSMATQIAQSEIPVLITGPNGSGKEKIAEVIQANSPVKAKPFIKVNVGGLPLDLLEAELFGAEAGAFTGANKQRVGRFEAADGGTLFLDEIGNLPLTGQVKLLRVLQTGEFERLGSSVTRKVNVRIISATNADLLADIKQGKFREDLYYRLNVIEVKVAPLCQRVDDILPLALSFLQENLSLSEQAEQLLLSYQWPGNVRELQNVIKRANILAKNNNVTAEDLGIHCDTLLPVETEKVSPKPLTEPTAQQIKDALQLYHYNISQSAKSLGLSRQSLYRRMQKYDIPASAS